MPRVNTVAKARKSPGTCSKCGSVIAKGAAYLWWKFMRGAKYVRCENCRPSRSDLTRSDYYSTVYAIQDAAIEGDSPEDLESARDSIVSDLENLRDETQGKLDNMPQGLQDGDTGQLLSSRVESLESVIDELNGLDFDDIEEGSEDDGRQEKIDQMRDSISEALNNIE
jgi:hypothetical protein